MMLKLTTIESTCCNLKDVFFKASLVDAHHDYCGVSTVKNILGLFNIFPYCTPWRVTTIFLDPAWFRCSQSQIPCHVPRFNFPFVIGSVTLGPTRAVLTCPVDKRNIKLSQRWQREICLQGNYFLSCLENLLTVKTCAWIWLKLINDFTQNAAIMMASSIFTSSDQFFPFLLNNFHTCVDHRSKVWNGGCSTAVIINLGKSSIDLSLASGFSTFWGINFSSQSNFGSKLQLFPIHYESSRWGLSSNTNTNKQINKQMNKQ